MKRLIEGMGKNSPEEYDRIYDVRKENGVDWFDELRWKKLMKHYKSGRLLDIGCLDSGIADMVQPKLYYGVDTAKGALIEMQERYPSHFFFYDSRHISSEGFDYAILGEVIEHLDNPQTIIDEAYRILKPDGWLALSTPLEETEAGEVDKERHIWSFSVGDIRELLKEFREVKIETLGSQFLPYYRYQFPHIIAFAKK